MIPGDQVIAVVDARLKMKLQMSDVSARAWLRY